MAFEKTCYQKLDEPVLVWLGLEFREVAVSIGAGAVAAILGGFLLGLGFAGILGGFGVGAALLCLFRSLRAGGPGYVFARLYRAGLVELLPRGLRPRYLLPLPNAGAQARFRLSAMAAKGERHARTYFGR